MEIAQTVINAAVVALVGIALAWLSRGQRREAKEDLAEFRREVREDFRGVRQEFVEVRREISGVRSELSGEISGLRKELSGEISGLRREMSQVRTDVTSIALAGGAEPRAANS